MYNDNKVPVTIKCQIITGKADKIFDNLNSMNFGDAKIYDFGSKSAFFCIILDNADESKLFIDKVLHHLFDDYVLIDIYKNTNPHVCIGISYVCLGEYSRPSVSELKNEKIQGALKKIGIDFTSKYSLLTCKYLEFHKNYNKSTFKYLFLQSYCLQFICDFLGYLKNEHEDDMSMKKHSLEVKKVKVIIQKVISELHKTSPTVQEMACMANMSVSKFKVIFNNEYEESPHEYILGKKLLLARELLQTGSYSVSQVCYKVGFNHPSGFTRLFKQKFHCTPSELSFSN